MSTPFNPQIAQIQQAIGGVTVDGKAFYDETRLGETWKRIYEILVKPAPPEQPTVFDTRTERNLATLHPEAQKVMRPFLVAASDMLADKGCTISLIDGSRTYAQQDDLYAQGRSKPGPIVTNAPGGYSNHNFKIAGDVGIFKKGEYLGESPLYAEIGKMGRNMGLSWGGDWHSFPDEPHYEVHPPWSANMSESEMLAELRRRHDAGIDYFA